MEINQALKKAIAKLGKKNLKNPHFDAEILLSYILKKEREFLLTHPEKKLTKLQLEKFNNLITRRTKGEPVAYLVGYKYFCGNRFIVNKNVLVPRPETEMMVDSIINCELPITNSIIIDIGTGSGCIIISLAKFIKNKCQFIGTDVSKKALSVAKKNAKLNKVDNKIKFIQGNLFEPILKNKKLYQNKNLIITANLPYGWSEWKNNCSMDTIGLKFEPQIALFTKENGLKLYRELFEQIKQIQNEIKSITLLCEIDPRQTKLIAKLIKKELPKTKFEIKKDLAELDRLIIINTN